MTDAGWLGFVLYALAVWRVSHMLVYDLGPWGVLLRLRARFDVIHDEEDVPISWPQGSVFACVGCMAVWVAVGLVPLLAIPALWGILWVLAAAGVAKLIHAWLER